MRYINPFLLCQLPIQEPASATIITNVEELLQAAMRLARHEVARLGSEAFAVGDLERVLSEWKSNQQREFHRTIAGYRKLYNFLEYGHLGLFREPESQTHVCWQDPDFRDFVRPYFELAYADAIDQATRANEQEDLQCLLHHQLPFQAEQQVVEKTYEPVIATLKNNIETLEVLVFEHGSLGRLSERELLSYLPDKSIEIYNSLPDEYTPLRNQLGYGIQQIAIVLNNEWGRNDGAEALVKQGLKLKLDGEVQRNLQAMLAHHRRSGGIPIWLIIGLGIMVLLFLIQYLERG